MDSAQTITNVCELIGSGDHADAAEYIRQNWPFNPTRNERERTPDTWLIEVWRRDGLIDRYSGERLVFPGTLLLLAELLPSELPYHRNGRLDVCHIAHWTLYPSVDHLVPISRGGVHSIDNLVTTSMIRNQAKANWTVEELCWELRPPAGIGEWDGLAGWFLSNTWRVGQRAAQGARFGRWTAIAEKLTN